MLPSQFRGRRLHARVHPELDRLGERLAAGGEPHDVIARCSPNRVRRRRRVVGDRRHRQPASPPAASRERLPVHVPCEPVHPRRRPQHLRRPVPDHGKGSRFRRRELDLVLARVAPHDLAGPVEDLERHRARRVGLQRVIDDRAVRRVLAARLVRRQRRVRVHVPAHADRSLRLEKRRLARHHRLVELAERRDVVEDPESSSVRGRDQVVVLDDDIAHRARRHIQTERLPVIAVVKRDEDLLFRAREKQALAHRVLADGIHRRPPGDPVHDLGPRFSAVVRPEDVRPHVVDPDGVDGRVSRLRVEPSGVHHRDLGPWDELRRRHVRPVLAAVRGCVDQAVIGPDPDAVDVDVRRRDRVDDAAPGRLRRRVVLVYPDARWQVPGLAGKVGADLLPALAAVPRFPQRVRREIERVRVDRRKNDRLGPDRAPVGRPDGLRPDGLDLPRPPVPARDSAPAVDDVRVERVGSGVAVFVDGDRAPVAERDLAVVAPARDARRPALLLAAVDAVGEGVVGRDVVELRRRLVVPGAPGLAAVYRDGRALVARVEDDVAVRGVDPEILIVVAARGALEGLERAPAVGRFPGDRGHDEYRVRIRGVDRDPRQVAAADPRGRPVVGGPGPRLAAVVRAEEPGAAGERDHGVDAARVRRSDGDIDLDDGVGRGRLELAPGRPAVGRFEEAAARAAPGGVFPWPLA